MSAINPVMTPKGWLLNDFIILIIFMNSSLLFLLTEKAQMSSILIDYGTH